MHEETIHCQYHKITPSCHSFQLNKSVSKDKHEITYMTHLLFFVRFQLFLFFFFLSQIHRMDRCVSLHGINVTVTVMSLIHFQLVSFCVCVFS